MRVPFFGLARENLHYKDEYQKIFNNVMMHGRALQGEEVLNFEEKVASLVGRKYSVAVNSCTDALFFALKANNIKQGDEVLVTSYSFIASASCILRTGAIPVFTDIDEDFHMNIDSVKRVYSDRVKAIIYPHMFGKVSDTSKIESFSAEKGLIFIEDAAQSLGAKYKNKLAGSIGDCSCISFDPTKVIAAPGSGGIFLTNDDRIANIVRKLRYHGKNQNAAFDISGYNSQMPTLTAALLSFKLDKMIAWQKRRQMIADEYNDAIISHDVIAQPKLNNCEHAYHKYVLKFNSTGKRNKTFEVLKENLIDCMIHYRTLLQDNPVFNKSFYRQDNCIIAKDATTKVLSLPIHPWLTDSEIEKILTVLSKKF